MPSQYGGRRQGSAIAVTGLAELQRALRQVDGDAAKNLKREIREILKGVQRSARSGVTHKTGRHGGADVPKLEGSIRTSVTTSGGSVYSSAPHALVQDEGGRVGHGAVIRRANASHYMSGAVKDAQPEVSRRLEGVLAKLEREFGR